MATGALVEEVALNLEEAAEVTRKINTAGVGFFLGGLAVGAAVGFYFGRRWNREKLRVEAFTEAEEDVAKIREYYEAKVVAATPKKSVEEIIEERGYSTWTENTEMEGTRFLPVPVPLRENPPRLDTTPIEEEVVVEPETEDRPISVWNYPKEQASRSPEHPYVIHQEELGETDYNHVTYTYYAEDDVLCDEDDTPLPHADIIVGQNNLKWGHGTDDIDVVFVRNDKLELDMEICRSHKSYEEEVLGHEHDEQN